MNKWACGIADTLARTLIEGYGLACRSWSCRTPTRYGRPPCLSGEPAPAPGLGVQVLFGTRLAAARKWRPPRGRLWQLALQAVGPPATGVTTCARPPPPPPPGWRSRATSGCRPSGGAPAPPVTPGRLRRSSAADGHTWWAMNRISSSNRWAYPHSLSYQPTTRTRSPSDIVNPASTNAAYGLPNTSVETSGS